MNYGSPSRWREGFVDPNVRGMFSSFRVAKDVEIRTMDQNRKPLYRYFLGLLPPPSAILRIRGERNALNLNSPVRDDRFHMTLWLSEDDDKPQPDLIANLMRALEGHSLPACPITLDTVSGGFGQVVLVANQRQPEITSLRKCLMRLLGAEGIAHRKGNSFHPHVTLAYDTRFQERRATEPIQWLASELVLIESHVGLTRHVKLASWTLNHEPAALELPLFDLA